VASAPGASPRPAIGAAVLASHPPSPSKSRPRSRRSSASTPELTPDPRSCFRVDLAREAEVDQVHFAWDGPLEDGHPNYWRLHGPITLIEYDNTQNDANHIPSVWHDLTNNWGRDLLREHYENGHAHG
jgi:hypothetical protein